LEGLSEIIAKLDLTEADYYVSLKLFGKEGTTSIVGTRLTPHIWPAWSLEGSGKEWAGKVLR
jgi:hypothetical protein